MRRTVRVFSAVGPTERLGRALAALPADVVTTLRTVADRADLPLAAGSWHDDDAGCLVANAVACTAARDVGDELTLAQRTLDLRMLDAFPQMSSRDLNRLIVAWDEAAAHASATTDDDLRSLLRNGLAWADSATPDPARAAVLAGSPPAP